jgi:hypothetical protein
MAKDPIRISGKDLGAVALPDFCPRCFWIKLRCRGQLPFQIFPGIFSSIDAYTKRVVHAWFDEFNGPPPWLSALGGITGYKQPPTYHSFNTIEKEFGILLTGSPDGVLVRGDGSYMIVDYKTAKFTGTQDKLHRMYEGQLNSYAFIGEQKGFSPVTGLALIYMEPVTDSVAANHNQNRRSEGFALSFAAKVLPVTLDLTMLRPLFRTTRETWELSEPPAKTPTCADCTKLDDLINRVAQSSA